MLQREFDSFHDHYLRIFQHFYPSKNSTGFVERNLSVNFATAYEQIHAANGQICFTWYELQFGLRNNQHIDACIINVSTKEIFLVEAKRFTDSAGKTESIMRDVERINTFRITEELSQRINEIDSYTVYGVILADIWCETDIKNAVYKDFLDKTYQSKVLFSLRNIQYYSSDFCSLDSNVPKWTDKWMTAKNKEESNKDNYKIVGFSWTVSDHNSCKAL